MFAEWQATFEGKREFDNDGYATLYVVNEINKVCGQIFAGGRMHALWLVCAVSQSCQLSEVSLGLGCFLGLNVGRLWGPPLPRIYGFRTSLCVNGVSLYCN
jgi:hypothetical protein